MKTLLSLLVALVALVSLACTNASDESEQATASPTPRNAAQWSVEDAEQFDEFPVYWLGESFQGLPLVDVGRMDYPGAFPGEPYNLPWNEVSFIYGDCEIAPGRESCPVPLQIDIRPYCDVPPEVIADWVKTGPPEVIRGAVAQRTGSSMRMWTGNVSIGIAATDEGLLMEAARNLVRLNGDKPSTPNEDLGPPDEIRCP